MTRDEALVGVIRSLRHYISDAVQADNVKRRRAYSYLFHAMQDLDIAEWNESNGA